MKNHIIFKFIAILLCAACILGAGAGIGGTIVLSAEDLYDRSVEDMIRQQQEEDALSYAKWLAQNYASTELGGCPEGLVENQYGGHWFPRRYEQFGYAILDAQGQELLSQNPEWKDTAAYIQTYTAEGKYTHLVSAETESQKETRQAVERMKRYGLEAAATLDGVTLPEEGTMVTHAVFVDRQGRMVLELFYDGVDTTLNAMDRNDGMYNLALPGQSVGYLYFDRNDHLVFRGLFDAQTLGLDLSFLNSEVLSAVYFFAPNGMADVALENPEGVGQLLCGDSGNTSLVTFESFGTIVTESPEEETVPETTAETIPETVPETTPETQPEETAEAAQEAETAAPEENGETQEEAAAQEETWVEEGEPSSASEIPEEEGQPDGEETIPPETAETEPPETEPAATEPTVAEQTIPAETTVVIPQVEEPVLINGKRLEEYQVNHLNYLDHANGEWTTAQYVYLPMPEMTVEVYLPENAHRSDVLYDVLHVIRQFRDYLLPVAAGSLLLFAVFFVYLCTAAGRKPKCEEVRAGGLNRLPLDLYLCLGALAVGCCVALLMEGNNVLFQVDFQMAWAVNAMGFYLCALIFVGFCFAFAAQVKTPGDFAYRNSLCGRCLILTVRFGKWMLRDGGMALGRAFRWTWERILRVMIWLYKKTEAVLLWIWRRMRRLTRGAGKKMEQFFNLMPVMWQWLVGGFVLLILMIIFSFAWMRGSPFWLLVSFLGFCGILFYAAQSFGVLAQSVRRMSKGDLDTKVDDTRLVGCFRESAMDLNALADVAVVAAQKQLKSERMKTELITNVSHDIKTPLTSIINYVDLLQKPHTEEEEQQYLEVLERQSQRLKKLIEDLMDMSKASTGNMTVEIERVDAVESVNQALGEFADKLSRARLIPVFRHSADSVPMMADGKLVWRVLSNILGNAVKYAMPGTRLYIDLQSVDGKVMLSLKNISREELNVDAEELMERFVRGDDSRNTEGSGLGLNIAKSLMELQKGQLQLLVDGDLFKVTLIFPGV